MDSMNSASEPPVLGLALAANEEAIRIFHDAEHICRRLKDRQFTDPAVTRSIHELANVCKTTIQECGKSQGQLPASISPFQDTSRLKDLILECHRRSADVVTLLDKALAQTTEEHQRKITYYKEQEKHLDNIFNTVTTLKERSGSVWEGSSPYTRVKRYRLRQYAETNLFPAWSSLMEDLFMVHNSEGGSNGYLPYYRSFADNISFTDRKRIERQYTTCLETTSHLASSFLAQTDPLYIHTYVTADQVPYKEDTEAPTASGSFGIVYKGVDVNTGAARALKQLKQIYSAKKPTPVLKELNMLQRCDHPNIIRLLDAYQIEGDLSMIVLVTEPWAPYTLSSFLHDNDSQRHAACPWFLRNSPSTERHIFRIFDGLASGLEYLHDQSIKHKDIKPDNILLYNAGQETIQPIIADLGVSKIFEVGGSTDYNKSTYPYLAPEQIDFIESTLKADVWQMGCCFALILAVFRGGSAGCRQLWTSFENSDRIALAILQRSRFAS
ncbi:kinase-like domain-containing protein [Halenospora varia]|nr:kinase-like domain-containing protein [Halenospora varia]